MNPDPRGKLITDLRDPDQQNWLHALVTGDDQAPAGQSRLSVRQEPVWQRTAAPGRRRGTPTGANRRRRTHRTGPRSGFRHRVAGRGDRRRESLQLTQLRWEDLHNPVLRIRDPVPFCPLDPGSGVGKNRTRIRDDQPESYFLERRNQFFGGENT